MEGAHGKPYLREYPQIQFNISHCMGMAVLAVGDCSVGIDVEYVRPYREPLLKRVLSEAELRQMEAVGEAGREELFFRFWTLKESYVKAVGCGITVPLQDISFQIGDDGESHVKRPDGNSGSGFWQGVRVIGLCIEEGEIRLAEQEGRP